MHIEWLRDLSAIKALRSEWVDLESRVQHRTLYSRYNYIMTWYRGYGGTKFTDFGAPLVGLARDGARLIGVAPMLASRSTFARIPVRRAVCAGFNLAAGEILVEDGAAGVTEAFVESLCTEERFELVAVNGMDVESDLYRDLCARVHGFGGRCAYLDYDWYAVADLSEGYDAYARAHSRNFRREAKRVARRVAAAGEWFVDRFRSDPGDARAEEFCQRMCRLAERSWRALQVGLEEERLHQPFYAGTFNTFAALGESDLSILVVNGIDVALSLGVRERGIYYHTMIAFDDAFQHLSPGTHLLQEIFKRLPGEGIGTVFSHGSYDYKRRWASAIVPQHTVCAFARGPRARLAHHIGFRWVHPARRRRSGVAKP